MAAYAGQHVAMGRMFGLDADMATGPDPDRGSRDIWGATIMFGPVVFKLFGSDIPELLEGVQLNVPAVTYSGRTPVRSRGRQSRRSTTTDWLR